MRERRQRHGSSHHNRRDVQTDLEGQLDQALAAREQRLTQEEQQRAEIVASLERFLAAGESGLRAAVALIEKRAEALGLATPVELKAEVAPTGTGAIARNGQLTIRIRRSADKAPSYTWTLSAYATFDTRGDVRASFNISAWRGGWQDIWSESSGAITTPECNPRGLSLDSDGEQIAARFMAWFTKYVAR